MRAALERRAGLLRKLEAERTDCFRAFHGAAEGRPGLNVDVYGSVLLAQTWREGLAPGSLSVIQAELERGLERSLIPVWNHRAEGPHVDYSEWFEVEDLSARRAREGGLLFPVDPRHGGRDPLFFLDFRAARRRVREEASGACVLNLFSYTSTLATAALAGGAREVVNVDFARGALDIGLRTARENGFGRRSFKMVCDDALLVGRQFAGLPVKGRGSRRRRFTQREPRSFDLTVLDPPRWARTPFGAVDVVRDYQSLFKPALLATRAGGRMLVANNAAEVEVDSWIDVLERCADKAGRPIESIERLVPDVDFPSFDAHPPLKLAWLHLR